MLLDVEVTPLDTDGDWTASCSELTWYDEQTATPCGPDVYDLDDDGDGIRDTRDAFPMDACATVDTDEDGQPDDVDCPPGNPRGWWRTKTMTATVSRTPWKAFHRTTARLQLA